MAAIPPGDDELVILASMATEVEAALVVNTLTSHGIPSTATGAFTSGFRAEAPGDVRVLVKGTDLAAAQEVLQEIRASTPDRSSFELSEPESSDDRLAWSGGRAWVLLIANVVLVIFGIVLWLLYR